MCHGESGQPAILKGESPLEVFFLSRCLEAAVESACIRARKVVIGLGGSSPRLGSHLNVLVKPNKYYWPRRWNDCLLPATSHMLLLPVHSLA